MWWLRCPEVSAERCPRILGAGQTYRLYDVKTHTIITSSFWQRDHWGGILYICYCLSLLWSLGWALIRHNWTFATCPQWKIYLCVVCTQGLTGKWDGSFREALRPHSADQMKISEGQSCQSGADRPHEQWLGLRPQPQQGRELQHPRNPLASSGEGEGCSIYVQFVPVGLISSLSLKQSYSFQVRLCFLHGTQAVC